MRLEGGNTLCVSLSLWLSISISIYVSVSVSVSVSGFAHNLHDEQQHLKAGQNRAHGVGDLTAGACERGDRGCERRTKDKERETERQRQTETATKKCALQSRTCRKPAGHTGSMRQK